MELVRPVSLGGGAENVLLVPHPHPQVPPEQSGAVRSLLPLQDTRQGVCGCWEGSDPASGHLPGRGSSGAGAAATSLPSLSVRHPVLPRPGPWEGGRRDS